MPFGAVLPKHAPFSPEPPSFSLRAKLVEVALAPESREFFARNIANRMFHRFLGRGLVMGALSGFAGSGGGLRGAALQAPLTAPRPAPRFTVHKNFSLQEQPRPDARERAGGAHSACLGNPSDGGHAHPAGRHIWAPVRHFMI